MASRLLNGAVDNVTSLITNNTKAIAPKGAFATDAAMTTTEIKYKN